jgi:ribokinase
MPRRVCVLGSINMDLVVRAPRFPGPGETILGGSFATFPGGKGANQAVAAARMGAQVTMIGKVGADAYGEQMRRVLNAEGIDTSNVLETAGTPTGVAVITVAEGGGNTIVVAPGANAMVSPEDVHAAAGAVRAADVLLMQLEVPLETVAAAAALARRGSKLVMLNAAPARQIPADLLRLLDVLLVNETEGELVTQGIATERPGARTPGAAAPDPLPARLAGLGVPHVVATLGEHGAAWVHAGACDAVGAFAVSPVDTVGAGDAFCGTLAATWDAGRELDALTSASAAGALATMRAGAIPSLPTAAEVRALRSRTR